MRTKQMVPRVWSPQPLARVEMLQKARLEHYSPSSSLGHGPCRPTGSARGPAGFIWRRRMANQAGQTSCNRPEARSHCVSLTQTGFTKIRHQASYLSSANCLWQAERIALKEAKSLSTPAFSSKIAFLAAPSTKAQKRWGTFDPLPFHCTVCSGVRSN